MGLVPVNTMENVTCMAALTNVYAKGTGKDGAVRVSFY